MRDDPRKCLRRSLRKVFYKVVMGTGETYVSRNRRRVQSYFFIVRYHQENHLLIPRIKMQNERNAPFFFIFFPEVSTSVELSTDRAHALKDYQENGVT